MIGDDGMPVLMDLGSVRTATRHVRTRKDELRISEEVTLYPTLQPSCVLPHHPCIPPALSLLSVMLLEPDRRLTHKQINRY